MQVLLPARPEAERAWRIAALALGAGAAVATGWLSAARSPLVAGGAVLGILLGLWALPRVEVALCGLVAVIALLPFGVVPLRLGAAPTLLDVATLAVYLLWLARLAAGRAGARFTGAGGALLALAGVMVAAQVLSGDGLRSDETGRLVAKLLAAHLLFIPLLNLVPSPREARRLAAWLVAAAAVEAAIGLALYAVPRSLAYRALVSLAPLGYPTGDTVLRYRPDTEILRATGTSVDPNMLGALLMVAGAIAVPQVMAARPAIPRAAALLALAPIGLCLLLTESRSSWLGLAAGVLLVGALRYRRLWLAFGLVAALAVALPQADRFAGHLTSGLRARDRASMMRLGELQNAARIISAHPWFGVGWGRGEQSIELAFTLGVSNVHLTLAERSGLPALAVYLAALLALVRRVWPAVRARLRDPLDDGLLLGLAAALAATGVAGMLDHHFVRFPHLVSLLWLVAALAVAVASQPTPPLLETADERG